jgi:hypothetical protein
MTKSDGQIYFAGALVILPSHLDERVSYNGYYVTFPRLRPGFDSLYPHHYKPRPCAGFFIAIRWESNPRSIDKIKYLC